MLLSSQAYGQAVSMFDAVDFVVKRGGCSSVALAGSDEARSARIEG